MVDRPKLDSMLSNLRALQEELGDFDRFAAAVSTAAT